MCVLHTRHMPVHSTLYRDSGKGGGDSYTSGDFNVIFFFFSNYLFDVFYFDLLLLLKYHCCYCYNCALEFFAVVMCSMVKFSVHTKWFCHRLLSAFNEKKKKNGKKTGREKYENFTLCLLRAVPPTITMTNAHNDNDDDCHDQFALLYFIRRKK